jgi:hypothetical protein
MANSQVFRRMFAYEMKKLIIEGSTIHAVSKMAHIKIGDSTISAVRQMAHYLYTGELTPDYDAQMDGIPLARIANKYEIKPLTECNEGKLVDR